MHATERNTPSRWLVGTLVSATLCVLLVAWGTHRDANAQGETRRSRRASTPPVHMKSGAERSEAILGEIAASLKRIESRLERLEEIARAATNAKPSDGTDNSER